MAARKEIECPTWRPRSKLTSGIQLHLYGSLFSVDQVLLALKSSKVSKLLQKNPKADLSRLLRDIPADQESVEIVGRFCHGFEITLSTQNIIRVACVAEYLEMTDNKLCFTLDGKRSIAMTQAFVRLHQEGPRHTDLHPVKCDCIFKDICSKVIEVPKLDKLQSDLVIKYFPPSFFDIMVHLTVHLAREVRLCGPVGLRWMYPIERCMKVYKGYVGSRKYPEWCIVQRYSAEEAVEFCSEYMKDVDVVGIPIPLRDLEDTTPGFPACTTAVVVPKVDHQRGHMTVLVNSDPVSPYIL